MANLKDLRNRIASVQSTQKITRAMQMVAASKLRRAQDAAEAARPYAERMEQVLASLARSVGDAEGAPRLLAGTGSDQTHLVVVATAERGLCGSFNSTIVRGAIKHIDKLLGQGKTVKIFCIGRKGAVPLRRSHGSYIVEEVVFEDVSQVGFAQAHPVAEQVLEMFEAGEFDICTVFYNKFESVLTQVVTAMQLVPAALPEAAEDEEDTNVDLGGAAYDYEPDEETILRDLLPRNVATQLLRALLENGASEMGAKMTAMDNATRNAGDMIDSLTITYNRSRQAVITKELIEIISGAEAL
ncbi:MAG: F0F1 ATP synthase subunit gamma [Alphaproteobacteria bacterium]|nr:MAG: F0F1 ATP synthase subunit gamma [Alphaproteobacteria bacterium]